MTRARALAILAAAVVAPALWLPAVADDAGPPPFDTDGFGRFKKPGAGRIDGVFALATAKSGLSAPQVGVTIECYPYLPYAQYALDHEAAAINKGSDASKAPNWAGDSKLSPYVRRAKTDADGAFHFKNLPRGSYVLRAEIEQKFPRQTGNPTVPYDPNGGPVPMTGPTVFDTTRAWFDSPPIYVGLRPPEPPTFRMVARHDTFDPRR